MLKYPRTRPLPRPDPRQLLKWVLLGYAFILTVLVIITGTQYTGEGSSYALTTVSLLHDHNAFVSAQEIALGQRWFPDWADTLAGFSGSGYLTPAGEAVPWYFPTYPAFCLPAMVLLRVLGQPQQYAFCLTNLMAVLALLLLIYKDPLLIAAQKWLLCPLFALNPILFYLAWPSAEVLQFFFVACSALCWCTGRRRRAALCIAVAGTMNPCALAMGLVMIAEYLVQLFAAGPRGRRFPALLARWREILAYGCCYLPGLPLCLQLFHLRRYQSDRLPL